VLSRGDESPLPSVDPLSARESLWLPSPSSNPDQSSDRAEEGATPLLLEGRV